MSVSRAVIRQSRNVFRQQQQRFASTTEQAQSKASDAKSKVVEKATQAKEAAGHTVSKASEGLSRVQSSASDSVASAASSVQSTASNAGGRIAGYVNFAQSLIPPTIYYSRVALEMGKIVAREQKMSLPTGASISEYFTPITNAVRNPSQISKIVPQGSAQEIMQSMRSPSGSNLRIYALIAAQVLGFFTVGEMIGRLKIIGYHGEVHHEEH